MLGLSFAFINAPSPTVYARLKVNHVDFCLVDSFSASKNS